MSLCQCTIDCYFAHESGCEVLWWVRLSMSVCLSDRISLEPHITKFLCILPMSMARSSSGMFTIGCIAYRQEGIFFRINNIMQHKRSFCHCHVRWKLDWLGRGDGSAQRSRSVMYNCFVWNCCQSFSHCYMSTVCDVDRFGICQHPLCSWSQLGIRKSCIIMSCGRGTYLRSIL